MDKIHLIEQEHEQQEFELFHECTKFSPYNIGLYSRNIARYLNDPLTIYTGSRNLKAFNNRPKILLGDLAIDPVSLAASLQNRESCRAFKSSSLNLDELGAVLRSALGVRESVHHEKAYTDYHYRPYPSGGGLYPVECYLVLRNVEGIEPCIAHYSAQENALSILAPLVDDEYFSKVFMLNSQELKNAAVAVLFTSLTQRSTAKYGDRGYRFALLEAGHAAQNLSLTASAQGLGCIAWGSFYDDLINELLDCDGVAETTIHALLIGHAKSPKVAADAEISSSTVSIKQVLTSELNAAANSSLGRDKSVIANLAPKSTLAHAIIRLNTQVDAAIEWFNDRWVIGAGKPQIETLHSLFSELMEKNTILHPLAARSEELIFIDVDENSYASFSSRQCPGVAHISVQLSKLGMPVLAHELCHALCTTGNRFLDEGLAVFAQYQCGGLESLSDICDRDSIKQYAWSEYRHNLQAFGDGGQVLNDGDGRVYASAFSLVRTVYDKLGESEFISLFKQLSESRDSYVILSKLEKVMTMTSAVAEEHEAKISTPLNVELEIAKARLTRELSDEFNSMLEQYLSDQSLESKYIAYRLLGTRIRVDTLNRLPFDFSLEDQMDEIFENLEEHDFPLINTARSQIIISKLYGMEGDDAAELAMEYQERLAKAVMCENPHATSLMDSALADHYNERRNDEPDFSVCKEKLDNASGDSLYGEEASRYLKSLGLV